MMKLLLVTILLPLLVLADGEIVVDIGSPEASGARGYGWRHQDERSGAETFSWIRGLEGDLRIDIPQPGRYELEIYAYPFYYEDFSQRFAIFLNNSYVDEWICHHDPEWIFYRYSTVIPAHLISAGENKLTFRMDYQSHHEPRGYSLAVSRVALRPFPPNGVEDDVGWVKPALVAIMATLIGIMLLRKRLYNHAHKGGDTG